MQQGEDRIDEAVAPTQAPASGPGRPGPLATVGITLILLVLGVAVFGFSPAVIVTLYAGMAATYVAIPYTAVAIVVRELTARRERHRPDGEQRRDPDAERFSLFRQRASLVTAIAMLLALLAVVGLLVPSMAWAEVGPSPIQGGLPIFGAFALTAGVFAIVVNTPSIYFGRVVASERRAMRDRAGAWRLIRANTVLTTASWVAYSGFALWFLVQGGLGW